MYSLIIKCMASTYYYNDDLKIDDSDSIGIKRKITSIPSKYKRFKESNNEDCNEKLTTPPIQRLRNNINDNLSLYDQITIDSKEINCDNEYDFSGSYLKPEQMATNSHNSSMDYEDMKNPLPFIRVDTGTSIVSNPSDFSNEEQFTPHKIIFPEEQLNERIEYDPRFQYFYSKAEEFTKYFLDKDFIDFDSNYYTYFINIKDNIFQILKKEKNYYNNEFYLAVFFTVFNNVTNKVIKMHKGKNIIIHFKRIMMEFLNQTNMMKDKEIKNFYQIENYYNVINLTFKCYRNHQKVNKELLSLIDIGNQKDYFHLSRDCVHVNKTNIFDILNTVKNQNNNFNKDKLMAVCMKRLAFEIRNKNNDFLTSTFTHYSRIVEMFMEYFNSANDEISQEEIDSYFE
jgi:hypothetical protein